MLGTRQPLTPLGKFLAKKAIEGNLSRGELAVQVGVSTDLLRRLMCSTGYAVRSAERVIKRWGDEMGEALIAEARKGAKRAPNHYTFSAEPDSEYDLFLNVLKENPELLPNLSTWLVKFAREASDSNMPSVIYAIAGGLQRAMSPEETPEFEEVPEAADLFPDATPVDPTVL